jgi:hypothetical protein
VAGRQGASVNGKEAGEEGGLGGQGAHGAATEPGAALEGEDQRGDRGGETGNAAMGGGVAAEIS